MKPAARPAPTAPANASERMSKTLGLWAVFSIATGAMISSGLFVLPGIAFQYSGPSMILAYAVAGILNVPTMLAQAELVTAMPKTAGSYFVVERSLGAYIGTVAGLINWCAIGLKAAFALIGIGTIAEMLIPGAGPATLKTTAIGGALFFTAINLFSVKETGRLQGVMVLGLIGILALYIGASVPALRAEAYRPFFTGGLKEFIMVTGMVFVSYGGLTKVVDVAEEVKQPQRNLPLGMFLSYGVVNVLYVAVAFVTVGLLPGSQLAGSLHPVQDGALLSMGTTGALLIGLGAFLAYATTGNAGILSASRSPLAMSHDGLLPVFLARTHYKFKTPHTAILLTGGIIILTIAFLSVENLVKTASTMLILSLAFINVSLIVMRHSRIEGYRPTFRMPLVPWLPLGTLLLYGFIIASMGMVALVTTFGFIAAASIWYILYVQHHIDRESAAAFLVRSALSKTIERSGIEDELVRISLERDEVVTDRFDHVVQDAPILDIQESLPARELFHRVGELLGPALNLSPAHMEQLLLKREREASTVVQTGIAIPHIVVEGAGVFHLALVRCRDGAVFSDLQEPVHVMFVIAGSPDERNFHLRALMAIAHVAQSADFMERWMDAPSAERLRDIVLLARRTRS